MGKRNIHILIEKFFGNDLSPEIQKKFHAWLLDRNFQKEKEKAMVTLWEEKSAVANESTFQELSRLHKRIEASDRMLHKPIGLYIKRIAAILLLPLLGAFGTYYYLTKVNPVVEEAQLKECFVANGEQKQVKLPDGTKVWSMKNISGEKDVSCSSTGKPASKSPKIRQNPFWSKPPI